MNGLQQKAWAFYRRLADRFPMIRKVMAPIRWFYHFNVFSYGWHRLRGISYREWYAKQLDSFAHSIDPPPLEGLEKQMGLFQLEYLKKHGLTPSHSVLDFGCGNLRAGVFFIEYLEPGTYVGAEISQGRLNQGQKRIAQFGLQGKGAQLTRIRDLEFAELAGRRFDFIWAQGVLAHMPLADIEQLFKNIHKLMHERSVFFVNYGDGKGKSYKTSLKDFYYNAQIIRDICTRCGLHPEPMTDWRHLWPHALQDQDILLKVTQGDSTT